MQVLISGAEEGRSSGRKASENWRERHLRVIKRVREKMQSEGRWSVARIGYRQRTGRPGAEVQREQRQR